MSLHNFPLCVLDLHPVHNYKRFSLRKCGCGSRLIILHSRSARVPRAINAINNIELREKLTFLIYTRLYDCSTTSRYRCQSETIAGFSAFLSAAVFASFVIKCLSLYKNNEILGCAWFLKMFRLNVLNAHGITFSRVAVQNYALNFSLLFTRTWGSVAMLYSKHKKHPPFNTTLMNTRGCLIVSQFQDQRGR